MFNLSLSAFAYTAKNTGKKQNTFIYIIGRHIIVNSLISKRFYWTRDSLIHHKYCVYFAVGENNWQSACSVTRNLRSISRKF